MNNEIILDSDDDDDDKDSTRVEPEKEETLSRVLQALSDAEKLDN